MGGSQLLHLNNRASPLKRLAPFLPISLRRYTQSNMGINTKEHHHVEEKAPTTADEFIRVAEEMAEDKDHLRRVADNQDKADQQQGLASQTVDKAQDAVETAFAGDTTHESVKERFKEGKGDFHKTGDDSDDLLKSTHK